MDVRVHMHACVWCVCGVCGVCVVCVCEADLLHFPRDDINLLVEFVRLN